jgi:hypothetical protein
MVGSFACCFARRRHDDGGLLVGPLVASTPEYAKAAVLAVLAGETRPALALALGPRDEGGLAAQLAFEQTGFLAKGTVPLMRTDLSSRQSVEGSSIGQLDELPSASTNYLALAGWECF